MLASATMAPTKSEQIGIRLSPGMLDAIDERRKKLRHETGIDASRAQVVRAVLAQALGVTDEPEEEPAPKKPRKK